MDARSLLVLGPVAGLVALTACTMDPVDDAEKTAETSQALCVDWPCKPIHEPEPEPEPPPVPPCNCTVTGPHGYKLGVFYQNGKYVCMEMNKCCAPGSGSCAPSSYTATWNPCYWPWPYLRCNYYGNCYCSSSP